MASDLSSGPARPALLALLAKGWGGHRGGVEAQVSVQAPLTVPTLGLGSQRWRRNEIMLFFISSAKKIFHLLPVRDARFSNKKMAVSLTSSCSCDDRCMSWVSPHHKLFPPVSIPHPALSHFSRGRLCPGHRCAPVTALMCAKNTLSFPEALHSHSTSLNDHGSGTWFLSVE